MALTIRNAGTMISLLVSIFFNHAIHPTKATPFSSTCEIRRKESELSTRRIQLERKCSMKKNVKRLIDEVTKKQKPKDSGTVPPKPPPKAAELDQDPGGGYNPDHTYPQT
jgi:hypothetical protein